VRRCRRGHGHRALMSGCTPLPPRREGDEYVVQSTPRRTDLRGDHCARGHGRSRVEGIGLRRSGPGGPNGIPVEEHRAQASASGVETSRPSGREPVGEYEGEW